MFQFTDDCLIGIKELDDEHRRLFSLINQAMDILNPVSYTHLTLPTT